MPPSSLLRPVVATSAAVVPADTLVLLGCSFVVATHLCTVTHPHVSHCISKTRCTSAPSHPHSAASLLLLRLFMAPRVLAVAPHGTVTPQHHTHRHHPIRFPFHNTPVAPTTPPRSLEVLLQHHTHCVPPTALRLRGSPKGFALPRIPPTPLQTRAHTLPPHGSTFPRIPHNHRIPPAPREHRTAAPNARPPHPHVITSHPHRTPASSTPSRFLLPQPLPPHSRAPPRSLPAPPLPFPPLEAQSGRVGRIQTPAPQSAGGGSAALHQPGRLRNGADPDGLGEPRGGRGPLLPPGAQVSRVGGGGAQRASHREGVGMLPGKFSRGATETGDAHPAGMRRAPPAGGCDA